ncbi:MAG: hypothetical protein HYY98_16900 [Burkholderiales bacterium]|nr:hypothetical protein [Burkholderiales bacterium]
MTDRPILFSGPMVRALLAGTKTQTRRVVKPQPRRVDGGVPFGDAPAWAHAEPGSAMMRCPYGKPGDRLWVKETWRTARSLDNKSPNAIGEMCIDAGYRKPWAPLTYEADGHRNTEWRGFEMAGDAEPGKTRVSIHMPRWASRITLEITSVRVERLHDISEADALAEGVAQAVRDRLPVQQCGEYDTIDADPVELYQDLWESINGPGSWDDNPWVWVLEFRRIDVEAA